MKKNIICCVCSEFPQRCGVLCLNTQWLESMIVLVHIQILTHTHSDLMVDLQLTTSIFNHFTRKCEADPFVTFVFVCNRN